MLKRDYYTGVPVYCEYVPVFIGSGIVEIIKRVTPKQRRVSGSWIGKKGEWSLNTLPGGRGTLICMVIGVCVCTRMCVCVCVCVCVFVCGLIHST